MKAMVLAAGLGTRLRPLTDGRPKAMVEVGGRTLLEITLARLRAFGIRDVIVNVHHFADKVIAFLNEHKNFTMRIEVSREDVLLDTGGGLKKAGWFFLEHSGASAEPEVVPFILHNVDVISTIDLQRIVQFHKDNQALATLAVQQRESSRYLLFDEQLQLCGRRIGREANPEIVRAAAKTQALAFSGIHVISPRLLTLMKEEGVFSIIDSYLRLAGSGEKIIAFRADDYYWRDLGKPADLQQAARDLEQGVFSA
ncbi:MAG TPA: nucleotidyltransferase family protein [Candidatus Acidoferrales bacterium]|nr:nucleotidyltransferase family protein [Candidatus Acidoferrales bacterium]